MGKLFSFLQPHLTYLRLNICKQTCASNKMQAGADSTGDPAQGCSHVHNDHSHVCEPSTTLGGDAVSSGQAASATRPHTAPQLPLPKFSMQRHTKYFLANLRKLPAPYSAADTNRMTLLFFCVAGLDILGKLVGPEAVITPGERVALIDWIYANQIVVPPSGKFRSHAGFIGGTFMGNPFKKSHNSTESRSEGSLATQHNFAHIAMTYTALATLAILGDDFSRVNRDDILFALSALQRHDGMFMSTVAGSEADMRFVYCAAAICSMLGDFSSIDVDRSISYIISGQTYDGSFALLPGQEAHGGSTFCATATLAVLILFVVYLCCVFGLQFGMKHNPFDIYIWIATQYFLVYFILRPRFNLV